MKMSNDWLKQLLSDNWIDEHFNESNNNMNSGNNSEYVHHFNNDDDVNDIVDNDRLRHLALEAAKSDNPYQVLKHILDPKVRSSSNHNDYGKSYSNFNTSSNSNANTNTNSSSSNNSYNSYHLLSPPNSNTIPQTSAFNNGISPNFESSSPNSSVGHTHDDKRRKNTLASGKSFCFIKPPKLAIDNFMTARFRDRKKQRESALEAVVERLRTQSETLEGEASNLRKENSKEFHLL